MTAVAETNGMNQTSVVRWSARTTGFRRRDPGMNPLSTGAVKTLLPSNFGVATLGEGRKIAFRRDLSLGICRTRRGARFRTTDPSGRRAERIRCREASDRHRQLAAIKRQARPFEEWA